MLTPIECGKRCRVAFGERFKSQWGPYRFKNRKIVFKENTVFALYSDFHDQISGWFYDVPKIEWEDWHNQHLLFILKETEEVKFLILDVSEANALFSKIKPALSGVKKINIRRPCNGGKTYIIEWKELPVSSRLLPLEVTWKQ